MWLKLTGWSVCQPWPGHRPLFTALSQPATSVDKKGFCHSVGASVGATQLIPVASISGNCVEIVFRWILRRTTWNGKELVEKCQSSDGTEFLLKYKSESSIVEFSVSKISSTYYQYCFQWPMVAKMMSVKITAPGLWLKILRPFFKIQLFF